MKSPLVTPKSIIAVIGVILVIILGFSFLSEKNISAIGVRENPQGVVFVPKQSPLMVSLLVNPQELESFAQFLPTKGNSKRVMKAMNKLRSTLLTQAQVDSFDDLQGWIGNEITFAVTSLDYDYEPENGVQPGYLLAVKTKNTKLASEFLQTYYARDLIADSNELIFDEYQGVNIVYRYPTQENSNVKRIAAAVVGKYVLFANDLPVLTEAINNAQAVELNLEHDLDYQNAIASLPRKKVSIAYLNLPTTSAWITNKGELEESATNQSLTLTFDLNNQGLVARSALITGEEEDQLPTLRQAPQTLAYVPEDSVFAVAGVNLQAFAEKLEQGSANNNPAAEIIAQVINPLESALGLNFQEEIFNKVTGEYAVAFANKKDSRELDWFFVDKVKIGEEPIAPNFDAIAQSRGLSVGNLPLNDDSMTTWTQLITTSNNSYSRLEAEVKGVHAQDKSYEVITSSVNMLSNSLNDSHHLLNSSSFQDSLKALPSPNNGYLYLRWKPFKPYLVKRFPLLRVVELGFKPLFDNLYSLTATNEGTRNGIQMSTVFFSFGK